MTKIKTLFRLAGLLLVAWLFIFPTSIAWADDDTSTSSPYPSSDSRKDEATNYDKAAYQIVNSMQNDYLIPLGTQLGLPLKNDNSFSDSDDSNPGTTYFRQFAPGTSSTPTTANSSSNTHSDQETLQDKVHSLFS